MKKNIKLLFTACSILGLHSLELCASSLVDEIKDVTETTSLITSPVGNQKKSNVCSDAHTPHFPPLVRFEEDGLVVINNRFEGHQSTILNMNMLSYSLIRSITERDDLGKAINQSRRDSIIEKFSEDGWTITILGGKSGFNATHEDISGFIAYHAQENLIAVIFHGSANDHDWETNLDFIKIKASQANLTMEGEIHRGFALKYASIKPELERELNKIFEAMPENERKNTQIIISGHSHGGSIASLATTDLAEDLLKKLFPTFDNPKHNRLFGYFISAPSVGDTRFKAWSDTVVGKENIISHVARHDVVASALPGRTIQYLLQKVPVFGKALSKKIAGYEQTGTLALEKKEDVLHRVKELSQEYHDADASVLEKMKYAFYETVCPLHFGSNKENNHEYIFDSRTVGKNLSRSVSQGENYNHKKSTLKKNGSLLDFVLFSLFEKLD